MGSLMSGAQLNKPDKCLFYEDILTRLISINKRLVLERYFYQIWDFLALLLVSEKAFAQPVFMLHRSSVVWRNKVQLKLSSVRKIKTQCFLFFMLSVFQGNFPLMGSSDTHWCIFSYKILLKSASCFFFFYSKVAHATLNNKKMTQPKFLVCKKILATHCCFKV